LDPNVSEEPPKITYPCDYPIKVVGDVRANLHDEVFEVVAKHDPNITPAKVSQKTSRKGNFVSISFMLVAESEAQIHALFAELKEIESVRLVL
jgi:putative lipoic acid-binding regulatory protein